MLDQVMQYDSVSKRFETVGDASRDGRRRVSKRLEPDLEPAVSRRLMDGSKHFGTDLETSRNDSNFDEY